MATNHEITVETIDWIWTGHVYYPKYQEIMKKQVLWLLPCSDIHLVDFNRKASSVQITEILRKFYHLPPSICNQFLFWTVDNSVICMYIQQNTILLQSTSLGECFYRKCKFCCLLKKTLFPWQPPSLIIVVMAIKRHINQESIIAREIALKFWKHKTVIRKFTCLPFLAQLTIVSELVEWFRVFVR